MRCGKVQKKRNLDLECLVGLGCFLNVGGEVIALFKHWLGFSVMVAGLLFVLVGISHRFRDEIQKVIEQRRKGTGDLLELCFHHFSWLGGVVF